MSSAVSCSHICHQFAFNIKIPKSRTLWIFFGNISQAEEYKSPFNHIFLSFNHMMGFCVLLCRSIWLFCCFWSMILMMIFCVCLNCCVALYLVVLLLHSNKCIFLWCGNKHIFIGLTHQTTMHGSMKKYANKIRKDYKGLGIELLGYMHADMKWKW